VNKPLVDDLIRFVSDSPTPYHCVEEVSRRLIAAGFALVDERAEPETLRPGAGAFIRRGGTVIAWRAGLDSPARAGFVLLGAHTDSPNLRLKPRPDVKSAGYRTWGVEPYGGLLLSTWLDRDLGISGRVTVRRGGKLKDELVRCDRPIARIPNLAIHLNRTVNEAGLIVDKQKHLPPIVGLERGPDFTTFLSTLVDGDVLGFDLALHDLQAPVTGGIDNEFLFSPRLDNQASCFTALTALLDAKASTRTQVIALFDHEEIGSRSATGAMGALLRDTLTRLVRDHETTAKGGLERALASSFMVSLDMAHGVHPNHADKHEPLHAPTLNRGPVLKEHVEQRYATDGPTSARFRQWCSDVDVTVQDFVIRSDLACGSTIGPISSADLGIPTVDVGNPMLSMHSIREMAGVDDTAMLHRVLVHALSSDV
jgi:aspartyl aminopeptidase